MSNGKVHVTEIQWCTHAANPIRFRDPATGKTGWGCVKVAPGCQNCYAEAINLRFGTQHRYDVKGLASAEPYLDEPTIQAMLKFKWKPNELKGQPRPRVFMGDMTDLFGEWVSNEWLDRIFAACAIRSDVDWLFLTKRPERMREYITGGGRPDISPYLNASCDAVTWIADEMVNVGPTYPLGWPLPNVWLGTSVATQVDADKNIPALLATPAAVRFISYEPALEWVDFLPHLATWTEGFDGGRYVPHGDINGIIVGGESGPKARPFDTVWARSTILQCKMVEVACFVKQLGAKPYVGRRGSWISELQRYAEGWDEELRLKDSHGGDWDEWPAHLRVREMPQ